MINVPDYICGHKHVGFHVYIYIYTISLLVPEMVGLVELLPCNAVEPENNGNQNKELASELAV